MLEETGTKISTSTEYYINITWKVVQQEGSYCSKTAKYGIFKVHQILPETEI